jgi:hypothetical protein
MAQTTIQGSFLGDGTVTGAKVAADFISAQTPLASGLATTDEIIVSDAGVIKRMDISVFEIAATQITASGTLPALNGSNLTALSAANITASGTLPALNGAALTALTAANITASGTLPALNGAALTALSAANITASGTLPALNGAALTALNGTEITSGTLPAARIAADSIVEGKLNVSNGPTNGQVLTARDGVDGGYTWEAAAGGAAQSPWTGNIDAANYQLLNVGNANSDWTAGVLTVAAAGSSSSANRTNLDSYNTNTDGGAIQFRHSKSSTLGAHAALVSGDDLGKIRFYGSGGSAFSLGAIIQAKATETFSNGSSNFGTKLEFYTTDNTTDTNDLRMTIDHDGEVTVKENASMPSVTKGIAKATCKIAADGTSYDVDVNISAVHDLGAGNRHIHMTTAMSSDDWIPLSSAGDDEAACARADMPNNSSSVNILTYRWNSGSSQTMELYDLNTYCAFFGVSS